MKCLCIATFVRIFCSCTASYKKKFAPMFEKMLLGYMELGANVVTYEGNNQEIVTYSSTEMGKVLNCKSNITRGLYEKCQQAELEWVEDHFKQEIFQYIEDGKVNFLIAALSDLIQTDNEIRQTDKIGDIDASIFWKNEFNIPPEKIVANVFWFCLRKQNNKNGKDFYKGINEEYILSFAYKADEIVFYRENQIPSGSPLLLTSKEEAFNSSFTKIGDFSLALPNPNKLEVFVHPIVNRRFKYSELKKCLGINIGYYVFSRSKLDDLESNGIEMLSIRAIQALKRTPGFRREDIEKELEKLLTYLFLEQALKAPKIFSSVEQHNLSGNIRPIEYGIHLHFPNEHTIQLVFGAAFITNSFRSAIDDAIKQIVDIRDKEDYERELLEENIFHLRLPDNQSQMLEDLLIPKKEETSIPETAFGLLLGYSPDSIEPFFGDNSTYSISLTSEISRYVQQEIGYVQTKIQEYGLTGYSFYIFVVPFTNAEEDKIKIMNDFLTDCEV